MEQLLGTQRCFLIAEMEVLVREAAFAAAAEEVDGGSVGEQGGWGVGGGGCVAQVAAHGAAVLVGDRAGPGGGLREQRPGGGDFGAATKVGEGGARADVQGFSFYAEEAELAEMLDADEGALREAAGVERDHELGAAGEELVASGFGGELGKSGGEGGGSGEVEVCGIGTHGDCGWLCLSLCFRVYGQGSREGRKDEEG